MKEGIVGFGGWERGSEEYDFFGIGKDYLREEEGGGEGEEGLVE